MPLVAAAALALVLGLAAGLSLSAPSVGAPVAAALLVSAVRRDARAAGLALVLLAGALRGWSVAARARDCSVRLAAADAWDAWPAADAAPGSHVPATVGADGCVGPALLAVRAGRAAAGERVRVIARPLAADGARLVLRDARLYPGGHGNAPLAARLRGEALRTLGMLYGARAPLARAVLLAQPEALATADRDRVADAGLLHLLAGTGLHLLLIAGAIELLLISLRLPGGLARWGGLLGAAASAGLLGTPLGAWRALILLGARAAARCLQRPVTPWSTLALAGAFPLVADPAGLASIGALLGTAGAAAAAATLALRRNGRLPRRGWRGTAARQFALPLLAALATAPVLAWTSGRVCLIAPLTAPAITPILALLLPPLTLSVILAPMWSAGAVLLSDAARPLLALLDVAIRVLAAVPFGHVAVAPSAAGALLAGAAAGAVLGACGARRPLRWLSVGASCLAGACVVPSIPTRGLELHLLDVGQGDAIAMRTPRGRWLLIDAGRAWDGGDAGRATVIPYVRRRGGDVLALVLSHPHADHVGGAASIVRALRPAVLWDPGYPEGSPTYAAVLRAAAEMQVPWHRVHPGDSLVSDGVTLRMLAPDSAWAARLANPNAASTIVLVEYGAVRILLVGDAEREEEEWLLAHAGDSLRADVLKVGHHGSATSSTAPFLAAVRPRLALVSVGAGNAYGHPSPDVLERLRRGGADVLRTDLAGSVVVHVIRDSLSVEAAGFSWALSPASSGDSSRR